MVDESFMRERREQIEAVRVLNVTKEGLQAASSSIFDTLTRARRGAFVALDTEFSGLGRHPDSRHENLQRRYSALREIAHTRAIFSIGLSIFNPTTEIDNTTTSTTPIEYNVSTFDLLLNCQSNFDMTPGAGTFLEAHGFDFNRMFRAGVPYSRASDDGEADDMKGSAFVYGSLPRGLLWRIGRHGVPIVVHNGLFDLIFLYAAVQGPLPDTLPAFIHQLLQCVPAGFWDSKVLASHRDVRARFDTTSPSNGATFLSYLFAKCVLVSQRHVRISNATGLPSQAATDPPVGTSKRGKSKKKLEETDHLLCALFAFKGFCPRGVDCPFSHDAFRVVQDEMNGSVIKDVKEAQKKHKEQSKKWKRMLSSAAKEYGKLNKKQKTKLHAAGSGTGAGGGIQKKAKVMTTQRQQAIKTDGEVEGTQKVNGDDNSKSGMDTEMDVDKDKLSDSVGDGNGNGSEKRLSGNRFEVLQQTNGNGNGNGNVDDTMNSEVKEEEEQKENGGNEDGDDADEEEEYEKVQEHSKKMHTAGWDAFCTGYIFASYRDSISREKLEREHNMIALSNRLSNLLLNKSEFAELDTQKEKKENS